MQCLAGAVSRCGVQVGQVLRGPRPTSVKWPPAREGLEHFPESGASPKRSRLHHNSHHHRFVASRSPEVVAADAVAEVKKLDGVLGETNPHAQPLVEAIEGGPCEDDSASPPEADPVLQDFSRTCQATCCSSRKCHCQGRRAERNLRQGGLRRREPPPDENVRRGFSPCARLSAARPTRVAEADRRVEKGTSFVESRTKHRFPGSLKGCGVREIPPMPTDHQELQGWISERNCDLRNAVPQLRRWGLISEGTAQLAVGSRDVVMDGSTRSALMAIEELDAKGGARCQHVGVPLHGGEPSARTCHGLQGMRLGSIPPKRRGVWSTS